MRETKPRTCLLMLGAVEILFAFWLTAALYVQTTVGLADNGDFSRISRRITSNPTGFSDFESFELLDKAEFNRRFFYCWHPYWKLDFPHGCKPVSSFYNTSALLLWYPSLLFNYFYYSKEVLWLPCLSLLPRIILVAAMLWMFKRIRSDASAGESEKLTAIFALGIPYVLIATATDYVAFLNSFYYETASLAFLLIFICCLLLPVNDQSTAPRKAFYTCMAALFLLATARAGNLYWPLLGVPFVLARFGERGRPRRLAMQWFAWTVGLTVVACILVRPTERGIHQNAYNRLFYGSLTFSENPAERLVELDLEDCLEHIGGNAFQPPGLDDFSKLQLDKLSPAGLWMLYREPTIVLKMAACAADHMHTSPLNGMSTRTEADPAADSGTLAGLWWRIKGAFFPRGIALYATLAAFLTIFVFGLRSCGLRRGLSFIGMLTVVACPVDAWTAVLGDGKFDLSKHLFTANLLFDAAAVCTLSVMLLFGLAVVNRCKMRVANERFGK